MKIEIINAYPPTHLLSLIDCIEYFQCAGGWLGYFSSGTATERYVLKKRLPFSCAPEDDRNLPDVHLGLYDDVIVFDHVEKVFVRKSYPIYQVPSLVKTYQIDMHA